MEKLKTHTLTISDVHLGAEDCRAKLLLTVLKNAEYQELIVLGDLCERNADMSGDRSKVIRYLRDNRERVRYVEGNHDPAEEEKLDKYLGIKVLKNHEWEIAGRKFCALHGHQFDGLEFLFCQPFSDVVLPVLRFLQKRGLQRRRISKWLDGLHERFCRQVEKKAIKYARIHQKDVVICGHTHTPLHHKLKSVNGYKPVEYLNSGSWQGKNPCSYITIDEQGVPKLNFVSE